MNNRLFPGARRVPRSAEERRRSGDLPGAHLVALNVLEWRLAPSSPNRIMEIEPDQRVIVVCKEGYSSSLAATRLIDLGVSRATDLRGGYDAWNRHSRRDGMSERQAATITHSRRFGTSPGSVASVSEDVETAALEPSHSRQGHVRDLVGRPTAQGTRLLNSRFSISPFAAVREPLPTSDNETPSTSPLQPESARKRVPPEGRTRFLADFGSL